MSNGTGYGISYKVTPVTTENITNVMKCFQVPGDFNATINIQSVLPDLSNFTVNIIMSCNCRQNLDFTWLMEHCT